MQIESVCSHCGSPFTYEFGKGHKRRKYCKIHCSYLANFYRHREYYLKRYQEQKPRLLQMGVAYRQMEHVQKMREGYREAYREIDSARGKERSKRPNESLRSKLRTKAKLMLSKYAPKVCCHCASIEKIHCHHINEDPFVNERWNLCWLCRGCHNKVHSLVFVKEKAEINNSISLFIQRVPKDESTNKSS